MSYAHKGSKLQLVNRVLPIDATTIFLAHYDITVNDVLTGIEPTQNVSTLRSFEGKYGGGVAIDEATTNIVGERWNNANSTMIGDNSIEIYENESVWKISRTVEGGVSYGGWKFSTTQGETYTGSVYLYDPYDAFDNVRLYDDSGDFTDSQTTIVDLGNIKRVEITGVAPRTALTSHGLILYTKANIGDAVWISAPQIEQKPYATSFTSSSREKGILKYELTNFDPYSPWTIHLLYKQNSYDDAKYSSLICIGSVDDNYIFSRNCQPYQREGNWNAITLVSDGNTISEWTTNLDTGVTTVNTSAGSINHAAPYDYVFCMGQQLDWSWEANGIFDELRIDQSLKDEDEVMMWHYCNSPFAPKGIYRVAY
ncbi:phage head spike fiber domain-containing protein [Chengkuizengella axinellae]|uniref:Uncharacterized protein n=1 Tax=Chengkuizengella axinellae TaxID=3064388 RepID=A0ABT9IWE2_9BACL|nr:hypothetical protein [Chengkuizengella sp. 2205SS18-9]MDP5273681.1 hypothetical protein [Chengkuizengella sp. 2205SS18-9]